VFAGAIGACLGTIATIRPVDAVIMSAVVGGFQLWVMRRDPKRIGELFVQGVAGAIAIAPMLYANAMTTGDPMRFGYDVMWGAGHNIGFHEDPYGQVHTLGRAARYALTYVSKLNVSFVAWPVPVLAVLVLALASMRRVTRWDALLLVWFFAQVAVYASYSLVGELLGPRFLYTVLPTLVILLARMPFLIADRFGDRWGRAAAAFTIACVVIAWCIPVGSSQNAATLARLTRGVRRNMRVDIAAAVREANVRRAIVFLREPLSSRLLRRMWGVGVPRGLAARLLQSRDACSILSAVRAAETGAIATPRDKGSAIDAASVPFVSTSRQVRVVDRNVLISSPESVTPECFRELQDDQRLPSLLFGPALPLEPIDRDGRISGDVIYVADLGERNEILRTRFGDRPWYRLVSRNDGYGDFRAELVPY
jgi:hypothetical protein